MKDVKPKGDLRLGPWIQRSLSRTMPERKPRGREVRQDQSKGSEGCQAQGRVETRPRDTEEFSKKNAREEEEFAKTSPREEKYIKTSHREVEYVKTSPREEEKVFKTSHRETEDKTSSKEK